ncbi:MAG: FecR domain-containing protein [Terriglobales bacterium]
MDREPQLRQATEAMLPDDSSLSSEEVASLLTAAGLDPAALAQRGAALAAASAPLASCADFQALLPAYRAATLASARKLLLEDHLHQCVACRHALHPLTSATAPAPSPARQRHRPVWAYAAAAVVVFAILGWAARAGLLPGQSRALATLAAAGGGVYAIGGAQVRPIQTGYVLDSGVQLRSADVAGAILRLDDGSRLELAPRTSLLLTRGWSGTTVHLLQGKLIVRAERQGWGRRLYVATADSRISDRGTVFAVAHGLMGSRVAVAEGRVSFRYERDGRTQSQTVVAGQEVTSNPRLGLIPLAKAFGWSSNPGQYLAMLGELSTMDKQLEALTAPAPRHHSALLALVPANAFVYAAIPNLSDFLQQAQPILQNGLSNSPVLSSWWNQAGPDGQTNGQMFGGMLSRLQQFTGYLGDEVAMAGVSGASGGLVVLASVSKPGLAAMLAQPPSNPGRPPLRLLSSPSAAGSGFSPALLIWIGNGKLVASHRGALLQQCAALAAQPGAGPFLSSALYQKIAPLYQAGANWILAADLNQLHLFHVKQSVSTSNPTASSSHLTYLVARSQLRSTATPTTLELDFSAPRRGVAGVLSAPGAMAGLGFVSPQASFAASFLSADPIQLLQLLHGKGHTPPPSPPTAQQQAFHADITAVAQDLGGEFTVAQDGPAVPRPAWKAIVEVNDTLAMQNAIAQLLQDVNARAKHGEKLSLSSQTSDGRTIYQVSSSSGTGPWFAYTYADSYLVAGSDVQEVEDALQTYSSGTGLPNSSQFQALLPQNGNTSFSALIYHDLNPSLAPVVQKLLPSIPAAWQPALQALAANTTPGLTYVIAQPQAITVASSRGLLGLSLSDMLALQLHHGHR